MKNQSMDARCKGVVLVFAVLILSSTVHADINTSGLKLVDASGVPDGVIHEYFIQGGITFYPTSKDGQFVSPYEDFWGDGACSWDQGKKEAKERFKFSGSLAGELVALFRCQIDPWLASNAGCVFVDSQYVGTSGKVYNWNVILKTRGRPLSAGSVTLAAATELSKKHIASGAPPPPPPKSQPKREPLKIGDAMGASGTVMAAPGPAAAVAKANLAVVGYQAVVEPNCTPPKPAMTVKLSIRNSGGPLPASKGTVYVKEFGGANLSSAGISLPTMTPGQQLLVTVPVISLQPYSSLAGKHTLQVVLNPQLEGGKATFVHPASPYLANVSFPPNHCQSVPRQPPGAGGNAAPSRSGLMDQAPSTMKAFPPSPVLPKR